jgi:hypothetical protein
MDQLWVNFPLTSWLRISPTCLRCRHCRWFVTSDLSGTVRQHTFKAFLGHFDFIYALPGAWFQVPFTFLGSVHPFALLAEVADYLRQASLRKPGRAFPLLIGVSICPTRLAVILMIRVVGVAKTNELLLFGKRKTAQEMLECGFYK